MDAFILIFKGLQEYDFHNHFALLIQMLYGKSTCDQLSDLQIIQYSLTELDYFSCLYERYEQRLLIYIKHILAVHPDEAADILQEAFIKIWRNLNEFDQQLNVSSWIYRIVHNESISYARKKVSFGKNNLIENEAVILQIPADDPEAPSAETEAFQILQDHLNKLPKHYRTVLVLRYMESMSYEAISDVLKLPEGTVATQLNRAKSALARLIGKNPFEQ